MNQGLRIIDPGLYATIQDAGRFGHQSAGVAVCGALDQVALRLANQLAGNAPTSGAIECLYRGLTLRIDADSVELATAGGEADITITRASGEITRATSYASFRAQRGDVIHIGNIRTNNSLYVAAAGGFDIAPQLGSQSTDTRARLGGLNGNALTAGDLLPLNRATAQQRAARSTMLRLSPSTEVRVVLGPQDDYFAPGQIARFLEQTYHVDARSNRMAMTLTGEPIEPLHGFNIISDAIPAGSIQVSGSGLPAILMADRQTTGGYPKIATVISAVIPALSRLPVGSELRFIAVTPAQAVEAAAQLRSFIESFEREITDQPRACSSLYDRVDLLLSQNLISGVCDAREIA